MAIEYKGIDSVSGKKRYYDTVTGEYNLGELASDVELGVSSTANDSPSSAETKTTSKTDEVPVYTTDQINQARETTTTPDPAPNDKPDVVETKTAEKVSGGQTETNPEKPASATEKSGPSASDKFLAATERNILNNYRSYTYNFAIGALTPEALGNTKLLERDLRNFAVLNSAGKGTAGVGISTQGLNATKSDYQETKKLVDGFNKESAGRFDMFIDNVEIESIIGAGSQASGASIATNVTFDVYEPLSMNGFIEALQVAGRAAGYDNYIQAAFALRVQFQGYSDAATNAQMRAEVIPMSTRYFPIKITQVDVDVTEQGTKYRVQAVPYNQMGFGQPTNSLSSDIKIEGETVGEVLKNFFDAINNMVGDRVKNETNQPGRDRYEISCPKLVSSGAVQNTKAAVLNGTAAPTETNEIIKAPMNDKLKSVNVQKFADPSKYPGAVTPGTTSTSATVNPTTGKLSPGEGTVSFSQGAQIHDCIAAIVRDSTYVKNLLKDENIKKAANGNGMVTYFTVRLETEIIGKDTAKASNFHVYRYVLEPYQIHYTRIPGQEQSQVNLKDLKAKIKREYNYTYTGKNVDVIKFGLKFNNLYYQAIPSMLGNKPSTNPLTQQPGPGGIVEARNVASQAVVDQKNSPFSNAPIPETKSDPNLNTFNQHGNAFAGQRQGDPYALMAQNLHQVILNSVDLISGNLDILGDPYWLVTGGMANNELELKEPMLTRDGQAPITQGDAYINLNFKNPIDINSKTGLADFGSQPISFSGVFRVLKLFNHFKDGVFTQTLDIIRIPGQVIDPNKKDVTAPGLKTTPRQGQQLVKDTANASILRAGVRPTDFNLMNLLSRGLPSSGLPGNLSNFTNSLIDKASGITGTVGGLLNQVQGATGAIGNLSNQLGVSPISGVNALTSGVRLAASGLSQISTLPNTLAATVTAGGNAIGSLANIPGAAVKLAGNVASSVAALPSTAISAVNQVVGNTPLSSVGSALSGITASGTPSVQTVLDGATGAATSVVTNVANAGSSIVNGATGAITNASGAVAGLTQSVSSLATQGMNAVSGLVGDAKNAVAGLQNSIPTDLNAVGAKLGIDTSALAGLSPELASKMKDELVAVAKEIPINTDLSGLQKQGISFASITRDKLPNLPALQPGVSAPLPITDPGISEIAGKFGNIGPLLSGNISLPSLTDINNVTNPLGAISAGLTKTAGSLASGLQTVAGSAQSVMGAVSNANSLVNSAVGSAVGITNNVGSLVQNSVQGFSPASVGLGSIESNMQNVAGLTQNVTSEVSKLGFSLSSQFGSLQSSPLTKLVQTNNIQGIV